MLITRFSRSKNDDRDYNFFYLKLKISAWSLYKSFEEKATYKKWLITKHIQPYSPTLYHRISTSTLKVQRSRLLKIICTGWKKSFLSIGLKWLRFFFFGNAWSSSTKKIRWKNTNVSKRMENAFTMFFQWAAASSDICDI